VGRHTEAVKIRNRVLYVSTSTSTWAHELSFIKKEIIKKFNARAGEEAIRDIRFKSK
jgi:predicted nucleic acid-binding Zn ribbon protein